MNPPSTFGLRPLTTSALAQAAALVLLAAGLALAGHDPAAALGAMGRGAFGSWYAFTSATLLRATPLIVIGLFVVQAVLLAMGVYDVLWTQLLQLLVGESNEVVVPLGPP